MKYRFTTNTKYRGTRYSTGDEIELSDEGAKVLCGLVEVVPEPAPKPEIIPPEPKEEPKPEPEEEPKVDYSEKTVKELRKIAEEKGIDTEGLKKAELIEALE